MRYFVFPTEEAAQGIIDLINERGRECYIQAGYNLREDGAIIGQVDGQDDPVGVTSTWDVPRQRLDGNWVVTHIEAHPMADYVIGQKTVLEHVMDGVTVPVEEHSDSWWPAEPDL